MSPEIKTWSVVKRELKPDGTGLWHLWVFSNRRFPDNRLPVPLARSLERWLQGQWRGEAAGVIDPTRPHQPDKITLVYEPSGEQHAIELQTGHATS